MCGALRKSGLAHSDPGFRFSSFAVLVPMQNKETKNKRDKLDKFRKERFDVVISSAQSALKAAFLVNGGGAIALLSFFGSKLQSGNSNPVATYLAAALLILVIGTALAGLATGLSFLAQYGYFTQERRSRLAKMAPKLTKINILLVFLSYVCFIAAGFVAYRGFL